MIIINLIFNENIRLQRDTKLDNNIIDFCDGINGSNKITITIYYLLTQILIVGLIFLYFRKYYTIHIKRFNTVNLSIMMMFKVACGVSDTATNGLDAYIVSIYSA